MHLVINAFIIFAVWRWADYKSWHKYHATMLFLAFMSTIYSLVSYSSGIFLWDVIPDMALSDAVVELIYIFVLLPCTVLLFLSNYPDDSIKKALYFLKYIVIYSVIEAVAVKTGRMVYSNGWTIWYSVLFYFLMFPAIIIHYKRPIIAYIVFILIAILGIWYFKLPIN